ncbi:MAG: EAL domain-containing protein [Lachnospiraceae bacterium]|nr:EAL domain-containing protein [Lachnospiraceae bacterium]
MNIEVQICGLAILFVILYLIMSQRKLPLRSTKTFLGIWVIVLLSLLLDIYALYLIENIEHYNEVYVAKIFKLHMATFAWTTIYGLLFVLKDAYPDKSIKNTIRVLFVVLVAVSTIGTMLCELYVVRDGDGSNYTRGNALIFTYGFAAVMVVFIAVFLRIKRKILNPTKKYCIGIWVTMWVVAGVGQTLFQDYLLFSFASAIGVMVIFMKLENPDNYIDRVTGLFNSNAFGRYTRQLYAMHKNATMLLIKYDFNFKESISYETEVIINKQIEEFVKSLNTLVFRESEREFIFVFDDEESAKVCQDKLVERFKQPWGEKHRRKTVLEWYFIPNTELLSRPEDVLGIFQYATQNLNSADLANGLIIDDEVIKSMYNEKAVENQIIKALENDRIEVFYQPIFSVKDKRYTTAEALVRIREKDGSIVQPGKFIHVAEKKGIIIKLGEVVFEEVCRFISEYKPYTYGIDYIEVNLSVVQCVYEHLAEDFIGILDRYKVDPTRIVLEITETASVREKAILLNNMEKLKEYGVRFALDDFGTGQSNLNYIVDMPVDVVKFDNTMTKAYFEDGTAKYVMDAAMHMIQGMELQIVSEGIERKEQYQTMEELGIDYIQGYYFSKPVEKEKFMELIKHNK